ncbi:hypothetical protein BC830DRAFT_1155496 [Chytriomyces sp. MP71]|nr:hypothetical protein BC830DRAFT_1155496 [Chytriomyces sp. MP71]
MPTATETSSQRLAAVLQRVDQFLASKQRDHLEPGFGDGFLHRSCTTTNTNKQSRPDESLALIGDMRRILLVDEKDSFFSLDVDCSSTVNQSNTAGKRTRCQDDLFSPSDKGDKSTPFLIKSSFKIHSPNDDTFWTPVPFNKTSTFMEPIPSDNPLLALAAEPSTQNMVENPFDKSEAAYPTANLLDEIFDISGDAFSPSPASSPSSTFSNLSLKPDEFILRPSRAVSPTTGVTSVLGVDPANDDVYRDSHPAQSLGTRLYRAIVKGGDTEDEGADADGGKTPMSAYFAEKSGKLGGLGGVADAAERPYFQTPKKDRLGRVVDTIGVTPRKGTKTRARMEQRKPLYIRSPAIAGGRVNVKWNAGITGGGEAVPQDVRRHMPVVPKRVRPPTAAANAKSKPTEPPAEPRVPVVRKPLYQPPMPRTRPTSPKPPSSNQPTTSASRTSYILTLPTTSTSSTAPPKSAPRKTLLLPTPTSYRATTTKKAQSPIQITLTNPTTHATPYTITPSAGGGTRDGRPLAFYSAFRLTAGKGVVPARGCVRIGVEWCGVLRGCYVQGFRVFVRGGNVPFTVRIVV